MVLAKSYRLRKASPGKFAGQAFWQPIKNILEPLDNQAASKWRDMPKNKLNALMSLAEYTINGRGEKQINEGNHFAIQQARIPISEPPTLKKIIQIALNIGQYRGINKGADIYNIKRGRITDFISAADVAALSAHITPAIFAGISKYLTSM